MRAPLRRVALVASLGLVGFGLSALPAHADNSSTVTIVGTSDVVDSNLVAAVLKPDFEKAYPKYTLNYVSQGTGPAISTAESGAASALLVHAASLENQFVAGGYSEEQYGRAIFYGDYVLLGPQADPAGVFSHAPHDIATAFERIAAAGTAGTANYVSRGGTPGTTVEEHTIWGLTHGVTTCTVSKADGGGRSPSTASGNCPDSISYPSWYHSTGLNQGPNVENADVCNYSHGNCYVLTDRGTYQYLASTHAISHLKIVTRDNRASARGGSRLLINSFHAYAINPAKFAGDSNVHINLAGAEAFLHWVTSPAGQRDVGKFMSAGGDPAFLPDAAPALSVSKIPKRLRAGHKLVVTGTLHNKVPGTPPLAGVQVTLRAKPAGKPATVVDTTTTTAHGHFRLHLRPKQSATYTVSSAPISQIEIPSPTLDPPFGDLLQPKSASAGTTKVRGHVTLAQPTAAAGVVRLAGSLTPAVSGKHASLKIFTQHAGGHSDARAVRIRSRKLPAGAKHFHVHLLLKPGRKWIVSVRYSNPDVILAADSKQRTIVV